MTDKPTPTPEASEAARALRAIPSEKRSAASCENGKRGGRKPKNYVYGWYHYAGGFDVEFRYPADREAELDQDGERVTVEIRRPSGWLKRRGIVISSNGNYTVKPA